MMVVERVIGQPAGPPDADEPSGTQQPQLMRHSRLTEANERSQVADASFALCQDIDEPHPRGVAQELEDVGHLLNGLRWQKQSRHPLERCGVRGVALIAGEVGIAG